MLKLTLAPKYYNNTYIIIYFKMYLPDSGSLLWRDLILQEKDLFLSLVECVQFLDTHNHTKNKKKKH